jgi:hypothetical protein
MIIEQIYIEIKSKGYHAQVGPDNVSGPIFTSNGLRHLPQAQHFLEIFFSRIYIDPSVFYTNPIYIILSII